MSLTLPQAAVIRGSRQAIKSPMPGACAIKASVGRGGVNVNADTRAVQTALNAVPATLVGAGGALDVDGICGPLTIAAIDEFQRHWLTVRDARCDPRGPTLALINAMAGCGDAIPVGAASAAALPDSAPDITPIAVGVKADKKPAVKPKPKPARPLNPVDQKKVFDAELRQFVVERHHMPIISRYYIKSLQVLTSALRHVRRIKNLGGTFPASDRLNPDRLAFLVVAKTFKFHESKPGEAETGIALVESILRRSLVLVNSRLPARIPELGPSPLVPSPLFISLYDDPDPSSPDADADAYAIMGGVHLKPGPSGFFSNKIKPGQVLPELNERIYLTPDLFLKKSSDTQRLTMIHELAHFVGSPTVARGIDDFAYINEATWTGLRSQQRLRSADSYGYFATECNIGTIEAVEAGEANFGIVPINPFVKRAINSRDLVIEIPATNQDDGTKFNFPAGAQF